MSEQTNGARGRSLNISRRSRGRISANVAKLPELLRARHGTVLPSQATSSDGNSEGSSVKMSRSGFLLVSAGRETTDEKQAQHFWQSQI